MSIGCSIGYEGPYSILVGYFSLILKNVQQRLSGNLESPAFLWNRVSEHAYDDRKRIRALLNPHKFTSI